MIDNSTVYRDSAGFLRETPYDKQAQDARIDALAAQSAQYVNGGDALPIASLLAQFPASAVTSGKYARVTDLYGSIDEIMRCRFDGANYRWVPQREAYSGTTAVSSGTVTITPLLSPPTLRFTTSTLTGNMTVTASTANAYIGQRQRIIMNGALNLGLFTATVTGLVGSNVTLLAGNTRDIEYGPTGWFQSS